MSLRVVSDLTIPQGAANGKVAISDAAGNLTWGTVSQAGIGAQAVGTNQLQDGNVTSAKIADGTILGSDIANVTITAANIANGAITPTQVAVGGFSTLNLSACQSGGSYNPGSRAEPGGATRLRGILQTTSSLGPSTPIAQMIAPAHYPSVNLTFWIVVNKASTLTMEAMFIQSNGQIVTGGSWPTNTSVVLDGITFST